MTRKDTALALLILLTMLAGLPAGLGWLAGHSPDLGLPPLDVDVLAHPLSAHRPSLQAWWESARWPLWYATEDGRILPWLLDLAGWVGWSVLAWWILTELAITVRHGLLHARQHIAATGPRAWISGLVATVLIGLSTSTSAQAATMPPEQPAATAPQHPHRPQQVSTTIDEQDNPPVTLGGVKDPPAPAHPDPWHIENTIRPDCPRYRVVPGDTLWDLAHRYLGDGTLYPELLNLNADRLPPDTTNLQPGWILLLPPQAGPLPPADQPTPAGTRWVTVTPGDTLATIAERELGDPAAWPVLFQTNDHRLQPDGRTLRDPNLLLPGWQLAVPPSTHDTPPGQNTQRPRTTPAGPSRRPRKPRHRSPRNHRRRCRDPPRPRPPRHHFRPQPLPPRT